METGKLDSRARGAQKAPGRSSRAVGGFGLGPMPLEWMGGGSSWTLPSGKALAEFALQAGFLAPLMLGQRPRTGVAKTEKAKAKES